MDEGDWKVLVQIRNPVPGQPTLMSCTMKVKNIHDGREVVGGYSWKKGDRGGEQAARLAFFAEKLNEHRE